MSDKPRLVVVRDEQEIEAIKRDGLYDPIGGEILGTWYAYSDSLTKYRERVARGAVNGEVRHE